MADKKPNVVVMKPGKGDALSIRQVPQTEEDRKEALVALREQKAEQQKIKEERFAKFEERQKQRKSNGPRGDSGININVDDDS